MREQHALHESYPAVAYTALERAQGDRDVDPRAELELAGVGDPAAVFGTECVRPACPVVPGSNALQDQGSGNVRVTHHDEGGIDSARVICRVLDRHIVEIFCRAGSLRYKGLPRLP